MFYKENPSGAVPPPLILLVWAIVGFGLGRLSPLPVPMHEIARAAAVPMLAMGVGLCLWSMLTFWRLDTVVHHGARVTRLITDGPFRFTRNPIYLGLVLMMIGVAVEYDSLWALLLVVPAALALHYLVIVREEAYLRQEFGDAFERYREAVRRWL